MRGPAPKPADQRHSRKKPAGEWKATPVGGWCFDEVPEPPDGVTKAAQATWALWFQSWWAAWWLLEDVPQLELALRMWDRAQSDPMAVPKFTALARGLGLTPKDRMDLRWLRPEPEVVEDGPRASVRRLRVADKTA
jgi:hypothetical protein